MHSLIVLVLLGFPGLQLPVSAPVESAAVEPEPLDIVRTEFDPRELSEERERTMSRAETPGRKLFVSRCALCHDPVGQPGGRTIGPWLDGELVARRGEAAVRAHILNGSVGMPGFGHQFDATAVDRIIAYLKTVTADGGTKTPSQGTTGPAQGEAAAHLVLLSGTTRTASGESLHGVAVSARAVTSTMTTTVYSDEQGAYVFPALPRGQYRVWTQATGYKTTRAHVAGSIRQEFTLTPIDDVAPQLRGPEWLAALPEETFEDRRLKEIFRVQCTECHQAGIPLQNRFDERGWRVIISAMEKASYRGLNAGSNRPPVAMRYHKNELARYLARMRGPGPSPMKLEPMVPRPTRDAARVVITEYDVPVADTGELVLWNGEDWSEGTPGGNMAAGAASTMSPSIRMGMRGLPPGVATRSRCGLWSNLIQRPVGSRAITW